MTQEDRAAQEAAGLLPCLGEVYMEKKGKCTNIPGLEHDPICPALYRPAVATKLRELYAEVERWQQEAGWWMQFIGSESKEIIASLRTQLTEAKTKLEAAEARGREIVWAVLHEVFGICGHCGKMDCAGRKANSRLPTTLFSDTRLKHIQAAIDQAGRGTVGAKTEKVKE